MEGEAVSAFRYGRMGLCVLHGADDYAGKPFVARSAGSLTRGVFPLDIAPQLHRDGFFIPAIPEFESLSVELAGGLHVEFEFHGELFETEDQRNWTDASFKTYSTPLRLGYPHEAVPGLRIAQRVAVGLRAASRPARRQARRPRVITIEVGEPAGRALPAIGASLPAANLGQPSASALRLVRRLGLAHVRVDVPLKGPAHASEAEAALERGAAFARRTGASLEVALHVTDVGPPAAAKLFRLLPPDVPLARVLVLDANAHTTTAAAALAVRRGLADANLSAPVGGGTPLWFAELNRDPPGTFVLDFICYGISPQLHLFDDTALMETLTVQGATVTKARAISHGKPVMVGPVVLMPRAGGAVSADHQVDAGIDPRQRSLFCAAWTLGSLKQLALAGAAAVTYFEAVGPRGLIGAGTTGHSPESPSGPALAYPVHRVLAEATRMSAGQILLTESSQPRAAEALASADERQLRVTVANLSPVPRELSINGLPTGPAAIFTLEVTAIPAARGSTAVPGWVARRTMMRGALRLTLGRYGIVRLEVPLPGKSIVADQERMRTDVR